MSGDIRVMMEFMSSLITEHLQTILEMIITAPKEIGIHILDNGAHTPEMTASEVEAPGATTMVAMGTTMVAAIIQGLDFKEKSCLKLILDIF